VPRYDTRRSFLGYIGACVDITDLLKKEKALHQIEERVALAADAADLGVWELNTRTNEMWISDKVRSLFQFPEGPVTYDDFRQRVHPDDRASRPSLMHDAMAMNAEYEAEYRIVLPDGNIRWIGGRARRVDDGNGKHSRLLGVSMDVTKRKQAEELFRLATEASPSGVILIHSDGSIVLANRLIEEMFGYESGELVGKPIEDLLPGRFKMEYTPRRDNFLVAPKARKLGIGPELLGLRKDRTEFPVEIGWNPIQTPQGLVVLATVVDISARKAAEEEARHSREQLDLLGRASLLGQMTASLAHELNQPLSAIVSNANAGMRFIERGAEPETLREILVDVANDGRRAHEIIRNVRSTIKKGDAVRERVNLNDLVLNVTHMIQPDALAHSCQVETKLAEDLPAVEVDTVQIQQVLINLLSNAFDAMAEVAVSERKAEVQTEYNSDETICLSVRDHGTGVRPDVSARLFEQFFTTKEEGLGMGLAIVQSIVEAHGGSIDVENVDRGGARFKVCLPISNGAKK
jgi:two-component system sensor kinase FixL